jgi:predicted nucleic acid-binding protein
MMRAQSRELTEDAMIAAIAKVNGLTVATRNTRDLERFGVPLVNPFTFER